MWEQQVGGQYVKGVACSERSFVDSITRGSVQDPCIALFVEHGLLVTAYAEKPDIHSIDKSGEGGGCRFCITPFDETDEERHLIIYADIQPEHGVPESWTGIRKSSYGICGECYRELRSMINSKEAEKEFTAEQL